MYCQPKTSYIPKAPVKISTPHNWQLLSYSWTLSVNFIIMEDSERKYFINSIKFYDSLTSYINQYPDADALNQYYSQKCKTLVTRGNINLPVKHTKAAVKCQRCCVNRTRGNTLYKVIPQKARGRFLRRIRKRNGVKLSRYQLKCAKKIQDSFNKRLMIKCKICQTEYKEVLNGTYKPKEIVNNVPYVQNKSKITIFPSKVNLKMKKNKSRKQINKQKSNEQMSKLNKILNISLTPKTRNLKEFLKSVT